MLNTFVALMVLILPLQAATAAHDDLLAWRSGAPVVPAWRSRDDTSDAKAAEPSGSDIAVPAPVGILQALGGPLHDATVSLPAGIKPVHSTTRVEGQPWLVSADVSQEEFTRLLLLLTLFAFTFTLFESAAFTVVRRYAARPRVFDRSHQASTAGDDENSARECRNLLGYAAAELMNGYRLVAKIANGAPLQTALNRELDAIREQLGLASAGKARTDPRLTWDQMRARLVRTIEEIRRVASIAEAAVTATSSHPALSPGVSSKLEAFAFLGVHAHANPMAVKKTIDGLRQCWHPDLAADEEDRKLREVRIRQINAAWELVREKRSEA